MDEYISSAPEGARGKLEQVRAAIREAAPEAVEGFSYRMPFYYCRGQLAWFGLAKEHIGIYLRPPVIAEHMKELAGYRTTKSAVHLPLKERVPAGLVKKLVRARLKMNIAEKARSQGKR